MKKILFKCLTTAVLIISVFILPLFYPTGIAIYFRLFLLMLIILESLKLFKIVIIDKKLSKIISNSATVLFSVFILFILLEAIFMFIPTSNYIFTLSGKLWCAKYWKPVNSHGFRDSEPNSNYPVILFVGDSFTAGSGLKFVEDRFSNIVGEELNKKGDKYSVINIGMLGLDSVNEYNLMKHFIYSTKIMPKVIVLQYCGNDIANLAIKYYGKKSLIELVTGISKYLMYVSNSSYFISYMYWSFFNPSISVKLAIPFYNAYTNYNVFQQHLDELKLFVDYTKKNSIQLIVVVFPLLNNTEISNLVYGNNIVNFFNNNKVSAINVSQLVKDIPVSERTIDKIDLHASKKVNEIVAKEIIKRIK